MFGWFIFNGMEWYHNHSNVWLGIFTLGCHTLWILFPFQSSKIPYPHTPSSFKLHSIPYSNPNLKGELLDFITPNFCWISTWVCLKFSKFFFFFKFWRININPNYGNKYCSSFWLLNFYFSFGYLERFEIWEIKEGVDGKNKATSFIAAAEEEE